MIDWNLFWKSRDETFQSLRVKIESPELSKDVPGAWCCRTSIDLFRDSQKPIFGATPLQAMSLAIFIVNGELRRLSETGVIFDPRTNEPIPLEVFTAEANRS